MILPRNAEGHGQEGLEDAALQLGWRPSIPWLSGALHEVVNDGKPEKGRMTKEHSGKRHGHQPEPWNRR